jgi:hypothetical protein
MRSGAGVLCIAAGQLIVGICLLGIYEGYKVRPLPPARGTLARPAAEVAAQRTHAGCGPALLQRLDSAPAPRRALPAGVLLQQVRRHAERGPAARRARV